MTRIAVEIPYVGAVTTVNHMYGRRHGRSYLKSEAEDWRRTLSLMIRVAVHKAGLWELTPPLRVIVSGQFNDKRSTPDLHNLKLVADAIEMATGLNDRYYTMEFGAPAVLKGCSPTIYITIEDAAEAMAPAAADEPNTGAPVRM